MSSRNSQFQAHEITNRGEKTYTYLTGALIHLNEPQTASTVNHSLEMILYQRTNSVEVGAMARKNPFNKF